MGYAQEAMNELHGTDVFTEDTRQPFDGTLRRSGTWPLTFATVARHNLERALLWHKGGLEEWSVSDWAVAMAGEAGEVCDAVKKLRRLECAVASNNHRQPGDKATAVKAIAEEIGDTFLYLDLLAQRLGLRMDECIVDTFNRISIRENLPQRL